METGLIVGVRKIVRYSIYLSLIGLLFLIYDKVVIQGIDYSMGLAVAREEWRVLGEEREGNISSVWSAVGYLVGSSYYVTLVVMLTQPNRFSSGERLGIGFASFLFCLANSVITGGRSNFMLLAMVAISALSARRDLSLKRIFRSRRQRYTVVMGLIFAAIYIIYVFYSRAQASEKSVYLYVADFLPYMGLEFDDWYSRLLGDDWASTIGNMAILIIGYLTHSLATFAAIVDASPENKIIIFNNAANILYKIGLISMPESDWFLAGRFPSFPGALWHQFGAIGFFLGALSLGGVAGVCMAWAARSFTRLMPLGMYVMVGSTLILSPYLFAPDFLSFPFVLSAFVLLAVVGRLGSRKHDNTKPTVLRLPAS